MRIPRMAIEAESPEQLGYDRLRFNLTESSVLDRDLAEFDLDLRALTLCYGGHPGRADLRTMIAARAGGGLAADDAPLPAGASAALFIIALTPLEAGDTMVAVRPSDATNIETQPDRHLPLGYGWPTAPELAGGPDGISQSLRAARA